MLPMVTEAIPGGGGGRGAIPGGMGGGGIPPGGGGGGVSQVVVVGEGYRVVHLEEVEDRVHRQQVQETRRNLHHLHHRDL